MDKIEDQDTLMDKVDTSVPTRPELLASNVTLLPTSVPRETRGIVMRNGVSWVPIFCANCGKDGGQVPEETKQFAFYLCVPCGDKWEHLTGTMMIPDEVFWENVKAAQLEKYGRELQPYEVVEALKDDNHILSKMAKDRYTKKG